MILSRELQLLHIAFWKKQPREVFDKKKVFQKILQNSLQNTCARDSLIKFIKKETLAQLFSCELCEFFKNTYFEEYLRTTASVQICAKEAWIFFLPFCS